MLDSSADTAHHIVLYQLVVFINVISTCGCSRSTEQVHKELFIQKETQGQCHSILKEVKNIKASLETMFNQFVILKTVNFG